MRLALALLALALPTAASTHPGAPTDASRTPAAGRICADDLKVKPVKTHGGVHPRKLGDLPPGDLTLTVLNRVGECLEPVVIREGYGAGSEEKR